jgi:hypothetical protein
MRKKKLRGLLATTLPTFAVRRAQPSTGSGQDAQQHGKGRDKWQHEHLLDDCLCVRRRPSRRRRSPGEAVAYHGRTASDEFAATSVLCTKEIASVTALRCRSWRCRNGWLKAMRHRGDHCPCPTYEKIPRKHESDD